MSNREVVPRLFLSGLAGRLNLSSRLTPIHAVRTPTSSENALHALITSKNSLPPMTSDLPQLSDFERARYEWQMWLPQLGEVGQRKLKAASVLVSRIGGVGGTVVMQLAAAGIGKLVLAHGGPIQPSDLNRQLLMTEERLGVLRVDSARQWLKQFNPGVEVVTHAEHINEENVSGLVEQADVIVDAAPRFGERFLLNRESVRQQKPMVECAMYELDAQLTTFVPGQSGCLACLLPESPPHWKREFPVIGAVPGIVGAMAALEVIKLITGLAEPLVGTMLWMNLATMDFQKVPLTRRADCAICG